MYETLVSKRFTQRNSVERAMIIKYFSPRIKNEEINRTATPRFTRLPFRRNTVKYQFLSKIRTADIYVHVYVLNSIHYERLLRVVVTVNRFRQSAKLSLYDYHAMRYSLKFLKHERTRAHVAGVGLTSEDTPPDAVASCTTYQELAHSKHD